MAVTVNLTDATVSIHGNFAVALDFAKSLPGRRYDAATKTNSANLSLSEFRKAAAGLQYEILAGREDLTGSLVLPNLNRYDAAERAAYAAMKRAEQEIKAQFAPRFAALAAELRQRITETGFPQVERLAEIIGRHNVEIALQRGVIQFSSPARRAQFEALTSWYEGAWRALLDAETEQIAGARWEIQRQHTTEE